MATLRCQWRELHGSFAHCVKFSVPLGPVLFLCIYFSLYVTCLYTDSKSMLIFIYVIKYIVIIIDIRVKSPVTCDAAVMIFILNMCMKIFRM